jgi:hypothetical protein
MLGLLWVVQVFVGEGSGENPAHTMRWENLYLIVGACVPEHKNEDLNEELKQKSEGVWGEMGIYIFSQLFSYGFTMGWAG